ncbi:M48 family metallopeptidase [Chitinibacteraceae bacterium HSL-7]
MQHRHLVPALLAALLMTQAHALDLGGMVKAGSKALQAATLTDADVASLSDQACAQSDEENRLAPAGDKYSKRLDKIAKSLGSEINGRKINYKVYLTQDVNAWAMANGCVRVYSGLMDMMNDDEVAGVIGHEIGHVALGHTKKAMQTAYAASAARDAVTSSGTRAAVLADSQLGEFTEALINAQFSQSQETDADNYSFDLLTQRKMKREGLVTAFQKLAQLDAGGDHSMLDSHPASADRAKNIEQRLAAEKK